MKLRKALIEKLFEAFSIQRWNDKIRTVELTEMDKNAHKMIIAFCLGKYEESNGKVVDWELIIKGGIFELLRRIALSDIKSPIYTRIKYEYPVVFKKLNTWVFKQIEPCLDDENIKSEFKDYLSKKDYLKPLEEKILNAAHLYASYWEFRIIRHANPTGFQINEIDKLMNKDMEAFLDLKGMRKIVLKQEMADFIDLCGQLRFQMRWGHLPRLPRTSVLGHMMLVACLSFFLSKEINSCSKRTYNNFFGGLFHDLLEVVTRDIINPVKKAVEGMPEAVSAIEQTLAEKELFSLLSKDLIHEIKFFTKDEFDSKVTIKKKIVKRTSEEINKKYNEDRFNPIDGEIILVADHLAAYMEAYTSEAIGIKPKALLDARRYIYDNYKSKTIAGIPIKSLYLDFN